MNIIHVVLGFSIAFGASQITHAEEPTVGLTAFCQGTDESTPQELVDGCREVVAKSCPAGMELLNHVAQLEEKPYWLAVEVACKKGTKL